MELFWRIQEQPDLHTVDPWPVGIGRIERVTGQDLPFWSLPSWRRRFHAVEAELLPEWVRPTVTVADLPLLAYRVYGPEDGTVALFLPVFFGIRDAETVADELFLIQAEEGLECTFVLLCAGRSVGQCHDPERPGLLFGPISCLYSWTAEDWLDWYRQLDQPLFRQAELF